MARFKISVETPQGAELISCKLKDFLYCKLVERISSREYIKDKPHLENLTEKYRGEIETIINKIKII